VGVKRVGLIEAPDREPPNRDNRINTAAEEDAFRHPIGLAYQAADGWTCPWKVESGC
jgi:hypothetical protein